MNEPIYSAGDVSRMTGASNRQLQYWSDLNYLVAAMVNASSGGGNSGMVRRYTEHQVKLVKVIMQLRARGNRTDFILRNLRGVPAKAFSVRYLLFSAAPRLLCATNEKSEVLKVAAAASGGVCLVELPI
jgi:hypothetical protein